MRSASFIFVFALCCLVPQSPLRATLIDPADARGVRAVVGDIGVLGFLSVLNAPGIEDRTILEFPLRPFGHGVPPTTLEFSLVNLDSPLPPGILDVFVFAGDGVVVTDDFFAGEGDPIISLPTPHITLHAAIDVTDYIQAMVDAGERHIGFRLSTEDRDRYNVGPTAGFPLPRLNVVPEPATLVLFSVGAIILARRSRILVRHRHPKGPETDRPSLNHRATRRLYPSFFSSGNRYARLTAHGDKLPVPPSGNRRWLRCAR